MKRVGVSSRIRGLATAALAACVYAGGGVAHAVPSPYVTKFGPLPVVNKTSSTLLRDTENGQTVWVLPPGAGKTEFKGLVPSANLGFCSGIKNLQVATNDIDKRLGAIAAKQETLEPELEAAQKALDDARTALGKQAESPAGAQLLKLDDRVQDLEDRREKAVADLDKCTNSCAALEQLVDSLSADLKAANTDLRDFERTNAAQTRQYNLAKSAVDEAKANLDDVGSQYDRIIDALAKLQKELFDLYSSDAKLEGGYAKIDYDTGWDANVQALAHANPAFNFQKIPTYNTRVFGNIVAASSQDSYYQSLPMILDYTIDGVRYVPWAETDNTALSAFPSAMAGNIRLSILGACPIIDPNFFASADMQPELGADSTPTFAISATYSYPSAFKFKMTASYNLYKFYEQIHTQGSSGGFFSSSSYNDVVEHKLGSDAFNIDWQIQDPNSEYTSAVRAQITEQLKRDLMNRVLANIAQPGVDASNKPIMEAPGVPPESGALVLADGLQSSCGFNFYCQAGGFILRGLAAIFGSSESESSFKQTYDITTSETWSTEIATLTPGSTSFAR